jgi:hypothetical protein
MAICRFVGKSLFFGNLKIDYDIHIAGRVMPEYITPNWTKIQKLLVFQIQPRFMMRTHLMPTRPLRST